MELSINANYLLKRRGTEEKRSFEEIAETLKTAGFKYIDFTPDFLDDEDWETKAHNVIEIANKKGIIIDQSHGPYKYNIPAELLNKRMKRSFEFSAMAGVEHLVIHADTYTPDQDGFDFDKALNTVYDFYAPYVEYAKKVGLGVAIENLFDVCHGGKRSRFTSTVEEQLAIIEKFNDPTVTACWDYGHGKVSYKENHLEAIKQVDKYISCTHVHDNIYGMDLHQNIFLGNTDWEAVIEHLKKINYSGKFTFEMVYGILPDSLVQKYMNLFYETGVYLLNI